MKEIDTQSDESPIIVVLGPTACGKTKLAVNLANELSGEVVSVDSRQVYRGMDIGSGKDLDEYKGVEYHLIDICDPTDEYNLFNYISDLNSVFLDLTSRKKLPILAGGTGMYLDAILNRYELTEANTNKYTDLDLEQIIERLKRLSPTLHNTTDLVDRNRAVQALQIAEAKHSNFPVLKANYGKALVFGIRASRDEIKRRITERLRSRLQSGLIEEVKELNRNGLSWEKLHFFGLEYRYIANYLQGSLNYNDMYQKLNSAIHKFAKQQEKWFRNIENKGIDIKWLDIDSDYTKIALKCSRTFLGRSS